MCPICWQRIFSINVWFSDFRKAADYDVISQVTQFWVTVRSSALYWQCISAIKNIRSKSWLAKPVHLRSYTNVRQRWPNMYIHTVRYMVSNMLPYVSDMLAAHFFYKCLIFGFSESSRLWRHFASDANLSDSTLISIVLALYFCNKTPTLKILAGKAYTTVRQPWPSMYIHRCVTDMTHIVDI